MWIEGYQWKEVAFSNVTKPETNDDREGEVRLGEGMMTLLLTGYDLSHVSERILIFNAMTESFSAKLSWGQQQPAQPCRTTHRHDPIQGDNSLYWLVSHCRQSPSTLLSNGERLLQSESAYWFYYYFIFIIYNIILYNII